MKWTITAVLGVILSSLASSILAYTDQLGEDGVLVPYVEIPFVTSTIVKNVGEAISATDHAGFLSLQTCLQIFCKMIWLMSAFAELSTLLTVKKY